MQQDFIKTNSQSTYAFPGATHIQAAGDCSPSFVCVESSSPSVRPSQNGNEDSEQVGVSGISSVVKTGFLTPEAFWGRVNARSTNVVPDPNVLHAAAC